jgi:hypothetical protein
MSTTLVDRFFGHYGAIGAATAVLSIISVVTAAIIECEPFRKWLAVGWGVIPPIYFFFELHWARHKVEQGELAAKEFANLKESQEKAEKIWAAVLAALSVLYLKGA